MPTVRLSRLLLISALLCAACKSDSSGPRPIINPPPTRPSLSEAYRATGKSAAGGTFVHLFEWKWNDIANECENVLGPAGYEAVQVSPPQEHSLVTPGYPWSERYQPVSYSIDKSRSGTRTEFIAMVNRCKAAGVGIYVDAVINHMTNFPSPGVGSNGTSYSKYNYPGLYTQSDFHSACALNDYKDAANVQDCELFSLPDLNTASPTVRQKIADYLLMLARLGVAGFRIDAAKHIQQVDLDEIIKIVNNTLKAESRPLPYFFLEIASGAGEALSARDYFGEGYSSGGASDVTEFTFTGVADKFLGTGGQRISQLNPNGTQGNQFSALAWGMMPADKAVVFLQNHDTQHQGGISYRDGTVFRLANVWMLAQPYGYPSILSSYAFTRPTQNDMGPPSDGSGNTINVICSSSLEIAKVGEWVCEHRDPMIAAMVGFRKAVVGTDITNWWDNGANAIAFSRGDKGFVAINREMSSVSVSTSTTMPAGSYCDLLSGGRVGGQCRGVTVVVSPTGGIQHTLASNSAVAIDLASKN